MALLDAIHEIKKRVPYCTKKCKGKKNQVKDFKFKNRSETNELQSTVLIITQCHEAIDIISDKKKE